MNTMKARKMKHVKQPVVWVIALVAVALTACGGSKQQQAASDKGEVTFIYEIENILKMTNGVVLMGKTFSGSEGTLSVGEEITYYDSAGEKMFTCKIASIGMPDGTQTLKQITADGKAYNLVVYDRTKDEFEISGYLVKGDFEKLVEELLEWEESKKTKSEE